MNAQGNNARKIRKHSLTLARLCLFLLCFMPVFCMAFWGLQSRDQLSHYWLGQSGLVRELTAWQRLSGGILMLLLIAPITWGLYRLRQLLLLFAEGNIFVLASALALRALAWGLIGLGVAIMLGRPLMTWVLTLSNPVGERCIIIGIEWGAVLAFLTGSVLHLLSWIMDEARKLEEDLRGTV